MNRSLTNVILGGYGMSASKAKAVEGTHTETDVAATVETLTQASPFMPPVSQKLPEPPSQLCSVPSFMQYETVLFCPMQYSIP